MPVPRSRVAPGPGTEGGQGLVELLVVLALVAILCTLGLGGLELRGASLLLLQREFPGVIEHAFELASCQGRSLKVVLGKQGQGDPETLPFPLPRGTQWGIPPGVPHPPGMAPTTQAGPTGAAHVSITVTPHRTCTAGAWFMHNRQGEVVCLRLSGQGRLSVLRWIAASRTWVRVNP